MEEYLLPCSQCDVSPRAAADVFSIRTTDQPQYAVSIDSNCAGKEILMHRNLKHYGMGDEHLVDLKKYSLNLF
jgi:hypothetical protein